ncbi:MAG: hypothetical protein E4H14_17365 [Candidatus Thorarchaeota archaeon]|nr:MAG: hypothetical protein E4H14_17365 [Candidatus Thorarchaeota archaeon]
MVTVWQLLKGAVAHAFILFVNFCVLIGIIMSAQLLAIPNETIPFLNALLLGYMMTHTSILLSIQLGVQLSELLKKRWPTVLITYYFRFSDQDSIPETLLDPIKSRLAVVIILLILSGGIVLYPIFAIVGLMLLWVRIPIIVLQPSTIIQYFVVFLNLVPPLLLIAVGLIVLSIIMVEFKRQ